jgi:hypothetical protein
MRESGAINPVVHNSGLAPVFRSGSAKYLLLRQMN